MGEISWISCLVCGGIVKDSVKVAGCKVIEYYPICACDLHNTRIKGKVKE